MTAPMRPQDGRHRQARLSLRARERLELAIGVAVLAAVTAAILTALILVLPSGPPCVPIVVESTGTWQHATPGPDPDWGDFGCVDVVGLRARRDLSVPVPVGEATP